MLLLKKSIRETGQVVTILVGFRKKWM